MHIRKVRHQAFVEGKDPEYSTVSENYRNFVTENLFNLRAQRERITGQKAVLLSRIEQRKMTVEIYAKQLVNLKKQKNLIEQTVKMRADLFESGHGSRVNLIAAQLKMADVQGMIADANVSGDHAKAAIQEIRNEIAEVDMKEKGKVLEDLSSVSAELAEVQESVKRLVDRVKRLDVVAPEAGLVHGLKINTPGAVVSPGQVLLTIVPTDEVAIVKGRILPEDIGHISPGQAARVSVSGFDARRYGVIMGKVKSLSPSTFLDESGQPYFAVHIELETDLIDTSNGRHKIVPGMTVTADIATGSQTLFQYLTGPAYTAVAGAFSER